MFIAAIGAFAIVCLVMGALGIIVVKGGDMCDDDDMQ